MKNKLITAFLSTCLISGMALADDDCHDPAVDWQPKERLRQMMVDHGWEVKRIKVDDGCYELKGWDRKGHRVEAKFSPASLKIMELEVKFTGSDDGSDYLNLGNQARETPTGNLNSGSNMPKSKPRATIE
ncbi:PepSY domain-containing protein [Amphritea opalescens]|uniref:PepSY domain-containing protein n=1 Tax=Amphritea opalescens TaxID=2490544 RepID=A0A430KUX4_9GAMM|nr:PepSY domain-containing protein [Amphritea opalescens]RTE67292.1 PepSY domain-containing protein [Amphritea opalescens]